MKILLAIGLLRDKHLTPMGGMKTASHDRVDRLALLCTGAQLLPAPLQERVPIWVGGEWPDHRAPFRRAARFDGVHPLLFSLPPADHPAAIADLVGYLGRIGIDHRPFDVVFGAETAGDGGDADRDLLHRFADAGVTWWMEPISQWRGPLSEIRERIRRGPPRL